MAWNQPGGAGNKDPWGKRKADAKFELDQAFRNLTKRLHGVFGIQGEAGNGFSIGVILIVAVAIWALTGFYVVQQGERGVVLRFGQKIASAEAGLHWHLPFPIERIEKVNVENISTVEIGFRTNPRNDGKSRIAKEALMLTQDEGILDVQLTVQYKITDPEAYLFNLKDPDVTVAQAAESAVREMVGRHTFDAALTEEGRSEIARHAQDLLQKMLDRYRAGISVVAVEKPTLQYPDELKSSFEDVIKATEEGQRHRREAEVYASDILPRARGTAMRLVQEAEGYKAAIITRADGDARHFTQIANEYLKSPTVTRERLYIEMMEQVLSNTTKVFIDQKNGNSVIHLPLDKLIPGIESVPGAATPAEPESAAVPAAKGAPAARGRNDQRSRRAAP